MKTIRQRLLGDATLDLKSVFTKARTLDLAQNSSESYSSPGEAQIVATADNEVESVSAYIVRRAYGDGRKYSKRRVKEVHFLLRKLLVLTVK